MVGENGAMSHCPMSLSSSPNPTPDPGDSRLGLLGARACAIVTHGDDHPDHMKRAYNTSETQIDANAR